jgi:hypothetical protein
MVGDRDQFAGGGECDCTNDIGVTGINLEGRAGLCAPRMHALVITGSGERQVIRRKGESEDGPFGIAGVFLCGLESRVFCFLIGLGGLQRGFRGAQRIAGLLCGALRELQFIFGSGTRKFSFLKFPLSAH